MKKYSEKELNEKAEAYFQQHPSVDKFIATEDGMFFTEGNLSAAKDHNSKVVKGELVSVKRPAEAPKEVEPEKEPEQEPAKAEAPKEEVKETKGKKSTK